MHIINNGPSSLIISSHNQYIGLFARIRDIKRKNGLDGSCF